MSTKICCVFNIAAHYRAPIYLLMDKELQCDFYLGDRMYSDIKLMDYSSLKGFKKLLHNKLLFGKFYWQCGVLMNVFSSQYKKFLMDGSPFCLSHWCILIYAKITHKETYVWGHSWYGREKRSKSWIKKIFFGLSSHILVYGDYAKKLMIDAGINANKIDCIYNSLDYERQLDIRKELKETTIYSDYFLNNNPVILYVGRLQRVKKIDMLLQAVDELERKGVNYNLVLVGEDVDGIGIGEQVVSLNKERIWFYGPCYDESKLGELFYNANLCVSPGNVGLTAIHSLVFGCPVITHDNFPNQMPEFEAIVNGVTGSFFKENDISDLVSIIEKWTVEVKDKEHIRCIAYKTIDERYNPYYQIRLLKRLLL